MANMMTSVILSSFYGLSAVIYFYKGEWCLVYVYFLPLNHGIHSPGA